MVYGIDLNDNSKLKEKISEADLITTSVGPKFVSDIFTNISKINTDKKQAFIAFENMYRASTNNSNKRYRDQLILIDAVVDKIVPPQKTISLDVVVEEYGSIILDEEVNSKPLNESDIVSYRNYENEFFKRGIPVMKEVGLLNCLWLFVFYPLVLSTGYIIGNKIYSLF